MRFLFLGNGNITGALIGIINRLGERDDWDITVSDIKDGICGSEIIEKYHDRYDVIVNLTDSDVFPILEKCGEYSLGYIDAGFETDADGKEYLEKYREMLRSPKKAPHLFGFGMNPGIVELIPVLYAPDEPYIACEIDTDLAYSDGGVPEIFGTWCPGVYADELVYASSYVLGSGGQYIPVSNGEKYGIPLAVENTKADYCVVPHEELFGFTCCGGNCRGGIFLYRGPENLQKYLISNADKEQTDIAFPPVLHDLKGKEAVGIVFYGKDGNMKYVVNRADHAEAYSSYGCNATCFQTACGIYTAINLIGKVPKNASLCFTDAAKKYKTEILEILGKLNFSFEVGDSPISKEEFEKKILPFFERKGKVF